MQHPGLVRLASEPGKETIKVFLLNRQCKTKRGNWIYYRNVKTVTPEVFADKAAFREAIRSLQSGLYQIAPIAKRAHGLKSAIGELVISGAEAREYHYSPESGERILRYTYRL